MYVFWSKTGDSMRGFLAVSDDEVEMCENERLRYDMLHSRIKFFIHALFSQFFFKLMIHILSNQQIVAVSKQTV